MGDLKRGWKRVKFGDVVRLNKDKSKAPEADGLERYVGLEHIDPGDLRVRSWGDVSEGTTFTNRFGPGHVLFGKRRAYQRKVAVADFSGVCSGDIYVLETRDRDTLLPELLPFICQTDAFFEHAVGTSAGSLSPRTNWKSLAGFVVALPPRAEQLRMVRFFQSLQDQLEALHQAVEAARVAERSALQSAFPAMRIFAASMTTCTLGELCKRITDGTHQAPPVEDSGVPFLKIGNISDCQVDWRVDSYVSVSTFEGLTKSFRPGPGDVLYTLVGYTLGQPVLVDWEHPFIFQRHIGVLRPDATKLDGRYLKHFLRSPAATMQDRMLEEGGRQKTVKLSALRSYRIPALSVEEQRDVAASLDCIESTRRTLEERHAAAGRLMTSFVNGMQP